MCVRTILRTDEEELADQGLPPAVGRAIVRSMETPDNAENATEPAAAHTGIAAQDWSRAAADPQYRAAVVDLLGALAYGELADRKSVV